MLNLNFDVGVNTPLLKLAKEKVENKTIEKILIN